MTITFAPLDASHFPLLLKWLEAPHVKKWWPIAPKLGTSEGGDQDVTYTMDLVKEKYSSRVLSLRTAGEAIQKNSEAGLLCRYAPRNDFIQSFVNGGKE